MTLHDTTTTEQPIFTEDLRARVAAVLQHVHLADDGLVIYDDARRWLAMTFLGLTLQRRGAGEAPQLAHQDELGVVEIIVAGAIRGPLARITQVERNELTGEALMGRWPFTR